MKHVLRLCRTTLGVDLAKLRAVWRKALALADGDTAGLVTLATRWVDIVGVDDPDDAPPPPCARGTSVAGPEAGDSTGENPPGGAGGEGEASADDGEGTGGVAALAEAFRTAMDTVGGPRRRAGRRRTRRA